MGVWDEGRKSNVGPLAPISAITSRRFQFMIQVGRRRLTRAPQKELFHQHLRQLVAASLRRGGLVQHALDPKNLSIEPPVLNDQFMAGSAHCRADVLAAVYQYLKLDPPMNSRRSEWRGTMSGLMSRK